MKKVNKKWQMCVDFTNLNQACPKDYLSFPRIDQLSNAIADFKYYSSLDAYFGYHQIPMAYKDEKNSFFITDIGTFCHRVMPVGLKNVRAIYQRMITKVFKGLIGRNIEPYVDNMLVKSFSFKQHLRDLKQNFDVLKRYQIKLHPIESFFHEIWKMFRIYGKKKWYRVKS